MVRHLRPVSRPAYAALALAAIAAPTAAWADDYPSDSSTQGVATTGELITGAIDTPGDTDWFTLNLTAGLRYTIDLEGSETGRGTLPDPYLRVHAADGFLVDQNDDGGEGFNSRMILRPDADETVYVSAGAYADAVGTYTLTISAVEAPPDDYPESVDTTGVAEVGGVATGDIEDPGDIDWFAVTLEAGQSYRIDIEGSPTGRGSLPDPYLYLFDSSGLQLLTNDDGGDSFNSQTIFSPVESGTYFIGAAAYADYTGTYSVLVETFVAPPDDFAADIGTTGRLTIGAPMNGNIEMADDEDWFAVGLNAGETYVITQEGEPTGMGSLPDPLIRVVDSDGVEVAWNDDGGTGFNSRLSYSPSATGTYYVVAGAFGSHTGTYQVLVDAFVAPVGDVGNEPETAELLLVNEPVSGAIDYPSDQDLFAVELQAGVDYTIAMEGFPTGAGDLNDPYIYLFDDMMNVIEVNDDGGVDFNAEMAFTPPVDGLYYIGALAFSDGTGSYVLSVSADLPGVRTGGAGEQGPSIDIIVELTSGETLHLSIPRSQLDEIGTIHISPN